MLLGSTLFHTKLCTVFTVQLCCYTIELGTFSSSIFLVLPEVREESADINIMLRNRNYFYGSGFGSNFWLVPFRFRLLTSYGSGFRFYIVSFFIDKFYQSYRNILKKKMLNEGHQINNFILCLRELLWFHFITVLVPVVVPKSRIGLDPVLDLVPDPQHCIHTLSPGQSRGRRPGCRPGPGRSGRAVPAAAGAVPPGPAA